MKAYKLLANHTEEIRLSAPTSLFFGSTPAHFCAANGWGTTALMDGLLSYWLLAPGSWR
ncbi:hypothetical protein [Streptomyces sp. NPDC093149]|uniref:hypothetical protein n=1 Tax=Streptomyces sp. NPDC093149 TaxID=3366031 RepID=UPI003802D708